MSSLLIVPFFYAEKYYQGTTCTTVHNITHSAVDRVLCTQVQKSSEWISTLSTQMFGQKLMTCPVRFMTSKKKSLMSKSTSTATLIIEHEPSGTSRTTHRQRD